MKPKLLTRDQFREGVFKRDGYKCVICKALAQDAHHIIERRLFDNGGYFLENGASVCGECHLKCEQTLISCEQLREKCGILKPAIPEHLYDDDTRYDKWANIILPSGQRIKGELFYDESVQKVLASGGVLDQFTNQVKYPRTHHLPWSQNVKKDDKVMKSLDAFIGKEVIITVKQDGENSNLYSDYFHARSINMNPHPSRNWLKNLHGKIASNIPEGWRICGENLYAKHSIHYQNLDSWFQVFSIWNERNQCLSWDNTIEWAKLLELHLVPVVYRGIWDEKMVKNLKLDTFNGDQCEGYVVRVAESFNYGEFRKVVGKFVRKDHVQTHGHWIREKLIPNKLKNN